jgi:hypothetical protein
LFRLRVWLGEHHGSIYIADHWFGVILFVVAGCVVMRLLCVMWLFFSPSLTGDRFEFSICLKNTTRLTYMLGWVRDWDRRLVLKYTNRSLVSFVFEGSQEVIGEKTLVASYLSSITSSTFFSVFVLHGHFLLWI